MPTSFARLGAAGSALSRALSRIRSGSRRFRLIAAALTAPLVIALVVTAAYPGLLRIRIQPGDTLTALAARYHTTVARLVALNHLPGGGNLIYAGQWLTVPVAVPARSGGGRAWVGYRVRPGDTLDGIAARFHVPLAALAAHNHLAGPMTIYAGSVLQVPGVTRAPAGRPSVHWVAYRVSAGDTLDGIAARYHVSPSLIAARNHLPASLTVYLGATLYIPASLPPAPTGGPDRATVSRMIVAAARRYGVDPALALAVSWQESGWDQDLVSPTGAVGAMQVEPYTGVFIGRYLLHRNLDLAAASDNIDAGVAFLALLTHEAPARVAVAGYYQGLSSVRQAGMLPSTRQYVADVVALQHRFASVG
jgi:LysM repeat protein